MPKKKNEKKPAEPKTVGQLKKLLESYDDGKNLADIHFKLVKPKSWRFNIEFEGAKIYADTEDEAYDEITRIINEAGLFPQGVYEVTDVEEDDGND